MLTNFLATPSGLAIVFAENVDSVATQSPPRAYYVLLSNFYGLTSSIYSGLGQALPDF